ncbi:polysaccharide deacetylase [Bacillus sp. FJAT-29953]|uniref:Polysaccharide deacetylase n=2 Tax=Bacillaceae TaxID=186817 RepID=A0A942U7U2_9BACI|nr:polysaccharide deacetylase [Neobacillus rhizophilus]MBU8916030.1 polysaccharide deacetylase [Bacillus sp. FJAT-29953]
MVGTLILLFVLLFYLIIGSIDEKEAKVKKSNSQSITTGEHEVSNHKNFKEIHSKSVLNEKVPLKTGKVVYLTFDDGPRPFSYDILNLLKKYNAKATFFMMEPNMRTYSEVVKQMVRDGHAVGVHGVTHEVSKVYHSPESFVSEMNQGIKCVLELTGEETRLIRPPYGSVPYITPSFKEAVDNENLLLWDWTIDSLDWKLRNGEYLQNVELQTEKLAGKSPLIVLLHEKLSTFEHLEPLLKYYHDNGYDMQPLNHSMSPFQFKSF